MGQHGIVGRRHTLAIIIMAMALSFLTTACGAIFSQPLKGLSGVEQDRPESSVVHIFYAHPEQPNDRRASGTGFVVNDEGVIATAAHVVEDDGLIDIKFARIDGTDGVFLPARVITLDRGRDVALLKVDVSEQQKNDLLYPVRFSSQKPDLGSPVSIFGFPESDIVGKQMRRSSGTVSSLRNNPLNRGDKITRMIEIEAKIEPGNSGSPVFDEDGAVVGVVSARWKTTDSYALAAPLTVIEDLLEDHYARDLHKINARMRQLPLYLMGNVKAAHNLAVSMRSIFPPHSEGQARVAQLEFCMERAILEGQLGIKALGAGEIANAWRHLQIMGYELESHSSDIAFLTSAKLALQAMVHTNERVAP